MVIIGERLADHIFCSYDEGMFLAQPTEDPSPFDLVSEFQSACFHEAGHTVVGYLLGQGCSSVSVSISHILDAKEQRAGVGYGGMARGSRTAIRRVNKDLSIGRFTATLARFGISVAAGPAAERRYRMESELPLRLLFASVGDHQQIDTVAKRLEDLGRSRFAYQRLVWRTAQRLLQVPTVWACVTHLAEEFIYEADLSDKRDDRHVIVGATARAIMNKRQCSPLYASSLLAEARSLVPFSFEELASFSRAGVSSSVQR